MDKLLQLYAQIRVDTDDNPVNVPRNPATDADFQAVMSIVFGIMAAVALLIIVIAGFRYVLSRGESDKITQAKSAIIYALTGLVVMALSYSLISFVIGSL